MTQEKAEDSLAVASPIIEQALVKPDGQSAKMTRLAAFTPGNLTEAIALAKMISRSDLAPKEYRNKPENCLIGMQYAAELGIPPLLGIQNISIINGRASVWGDLFLAIIQTSPAYEWHKEWTEGTGDDFGAVCQMKRRGQEVHTVKFTVRDAKTARLWNKEGTWQTNPKRMLQMRSRGFAGRDKFADALKGLIIAEEAMDLPIDTSPAKQARDTASLDLAPTVGDLTPSSEPNRGHDQTGLQRTKPDEQNQPAPKQEITICSECRQQIDANGNGHLPDCIVLQKREQDKRTSKPTTPVLYQVLTVKEDFKKGKGGVKGSRFLKLQVVTPTPSGDKEGLLYVWYGSFSEFFPVGQFDKRLVAEVSEQTKDNKKFFQLEHILELGGIPFVNDKPAVQGNLNIDPGPVPDDEWEEEGDGGKETEAEAEAAKD